MVKPDPGVKDDLRRLAEASAWRVTLFEAGVDTSEAFEGWLAEDPRNTQAWDDVQTPWALFGQQATSPELMAARRRALENVERQSQGVSRRLWAGIAAVLAILIVGAGWTATEWWRAHAPQLYQTALGERRTVTLADGSRIALDSNSAVQVSLLQRARELDLIRGQARFYVAHDPSRPFMVKTGGQTVIATGTNFNVDRFGSNVVVTLIEGRVSVVKDKASSWAGTDPKSIGPVIAKLTPGEQLVTAIPAGAASSAVLAKVVDVDVERATAWEVGQIVFDDDTLGAVTERVSRYSAHPVVAEGAAAGLKLSGVFDSGDVATFVDTVQRVLPVRAQAGEDGSLHLWLKERPGEVEPPKA